MKEFVAVVAALLAVVGNVPYVAQVLKGKVRPHPYTWFVGSVVSCTVFFGMVAKGAGIGALPVAASEIFTVLIFILSIKYGFTRITFSDKVCLVFALGGLIPWVLTQDPTLSVVIAVGIDLLGLAPTLRKTWYHPKTEAPILYGANVFRHALGLMSLQTYNIATTLHSVAMIVSNSAILGIIFTRRARRR